MLISIILFPKPLLLIKGTLSVNSSEPPCKDAMPD